MSRNREKFFQVFVRLENHKMRQVAEFQGMDVPERFKTDEFIIWDWMNHQSIVGKQITKWNVEQRNEDEPNE